MRLQLSSMATCAFFSIVPAVLGLASTDSYRDADAGQSGYLPNHNMDPAIVDSPQFGQLWKKAFNPNEQVRLASGNQVPDALGPWVGSETMADYCCSSMQNRWYIRLLLVGTSCFFWHLRRTIFGYWTPKQGPRSIPAKCTRRSCNPILRMCSLLQ